MEHGPGKLIATADCLAQNSAVDYKGALNNSLNIMLKMGWRPGQCLGRTQNQLCLREPITVVGKMDRSGLGFVFEGSDAAIGGDNRVGDDYFRELVDRLKLIGTVPRFVVKRSEEEDLFDIRTDNIVSCSIFDDFNYAEGENNGYLPSLPELRLIVGDTYVDCLIDTGSQVTAVSYDYFQELRKSIKIPVIPITNLYLRGAIGNKSSKINTLALIPLQFQGKVLNTPCLVVDNLIRPIILGFNWLIDNNVQIQCSESPRIVIGSLGDLMLPVNESCVVKIKDERAAAAEGNLCCNGISVTDTLMSDNEIGDYVSRLGLSTEAENLLILLIRKRRRVFRKEIGCTSMYEHRIQMIKELPFARKQYPVPIAYRQKIEEKLKELEDQGIVKRTATPYASPMTYTIKKDGSIRLLLDARELNSRIEGETENPPVISELLQRFHGVKYISTLDLNNAYFQIKLHKDSVKYTGFVFNNKSYVYLRLPQGLKTAVSGFTRAMDVILGPEVADFTANYLDDVCCFSRTDLQGHMNHLDKILERFELAGLTCNLEKCQFLRHKVKMLGHVLSIDGIEMDEEKVEAIKLFPTPKNIKQLRAFLGLCNYYRRFVDKYGFLTCKLNELLKKGIRWRWEEEHQKTFNKIKEKFLESVILKFPDPNKTYYLQTDSSGYALGGALYQLDDEGKQHVMAFCSKGFTEAEKRWTVSEQEMWAIIYCLKKFETYLRGVKVVIKTDHHSLTFLRTWKMHCNRVTRWLIFLNQFDYTIEYISGKDNIAVDVISRYSSDAKKIQEQKQFLPEIAALIETGNKKLKAILINIRVEQNKDSELDSVKRRLSSDHLLQIKLGRGEEYYKLIDDVLYSVGRGGTQRLVIPINKAKDFILHYHCELGHAGSSKVIQVLKAKYNWIGLAKQVKEILRTCHDCQMAKINNNNTVGPCKPVLAGKINEKVMGDLYGPLPAAKFGYAYIFVLQDAFSKFVMLFPIRIANTQNVLRCVRKFCQATGTPEVIVTDNGTQFRSKTWLEAIKNMGIKPTYTSVHNPRPNSTERFHRDLGNMLRIYCHNKHTSWADVLARIENAHNDTVHGSHGYTPNYLMFGKRYKSNIENKNLKIIETDESLEEARKNAYLNLKKNSEIRVRSFNKSNTLIEYKIGQLVKLRTYPKSDMTKKQCAKLFYKYEGPYVVAARPYENTYTLMEPDCNKIKGNYNAYNLERYYK